LPLFGDRSFSCLIEGVGKEYGYSLVTARLLDYFSNIFPLFEKLLQKH
jgi:hypothetical protein